MAPLVRLRACKWLMSANAVGRLAPAVHRAAVAQRAPRRSASNFNAYVAQRAKQPFVPRGTAVIPRQTRPEPSTYDTKPIITERQRRAENRTQLSKYIRAGFEMYADQ